MTTPVGQGQGGQLPGAVELSRRVFRAVSHRDAPGAVSGTAETLHLEVSSAVTTGAFQHQDLWAGVSIDGRDHVRDYLLRLFRVLPSLTMVTILRDGADDPEGAEFTAEMAGVTTEGKPFDASGRISVLTDGERISTVRAVITHLAVGPQLLRRTGHDPRKYFEYFLEEAGGSPPSDRSGTSGARIDATRGAA